MAREGKFYGDCRLDPRPGRQWVADLLASQPGGERKIRHRPHDRSVVQERGRTRVVLLLRTRQTGWMS